MQSNNKGVSATMQRFWQFSDKKRIGIIPVPLFLLGLFLLGITLFLIEKGLLLGKKGTPYNVATEMVTMIVILGIGGFICGYIGKKIPILGRMGAPAICATFIPSFIVWFFKVYLIREGYIAEDSGIAAATNQLFDATTTFYKNTNILYVYICCIIVGSIMSMDRHTLIQGFLKIFGPMAAGVLVGMPVGLTVAVLLGFDPYYAFFFLILPIMAGGVGEGAIPLSIGYAAIIGIDQGVALGKVLPIVMLGSLTAIFISGFLNRLGEKKPHLTGNGRLIPSEQDVSALQQELDVKPDPTYAASGLILACLFFMFGIILETVSMHRIPAPIGMLLGAIVFKLLNIVSPTILSGSRATYKFVQTSVTFPILYAVGVAITPWEKIIEAFHILNLIVIFFTVCSVVTAGFFMAKFMKMYPIDTAIISCCQCGQGGTGDVAILTAAERMELMPFAQIATRCGGAINVTIALFMLGQFVNTEALLQLIS